MKTSIVTKGTLIVAALAAGVFATLMPHAAARAVANNCYCYTDLNKIKGSDLGTGTTNKTYNDCLPTPDACGTILPSLQASYPQVLYLTCNDLKYEPVDCEQKKTQWTASAVKLGQQLNNYTKAFSFTGSLVPACLFDANITTQCRDVSVFVQLLINWGTTSFAILGTFALVFFVYGGFILILSRGNPEQIKKGTDVMLSAVIGVAVAFLGYIFIKAMGEAIGVKPIYNLSYIVLFV